MSRRLILRGWKEHPHLWKIEPYSEESWGKIPEEDSKVLSHYMHKEFADYEECRKWVLQDLKVRRKEIGRLMDSWLKREQLKGEEEKPDHGEIWC